MFSILPLLRSSTTRTAAPRSTSASTKCEPMKDAPPVTRTLRLLQSIEALQGIHGVSDPGCLTGCWRRAPGEAWSSSQGHVVCHLIKLLGIQSTPTVYQRRTAIRIVQIACGQIPKLIPWCGDDDNIGLASAFSNRSGENGVRAQGMAGGIHSCWVVQDDRNATRQQVT